MDVEFGAAKDTVTRALYYGAGKAYRYFAQYLTRRQAEDMHQLVIIYRTRYQ
jgi:hypothetical protein